MDPEGTAYANLLVGNAEGSAVVEGRIEETAPETSEPAAASSPQPAPGTQAQSVAVVQIQADGGLLELATADVEADGSYTVSTVPAGWSDHPDSHCRKEQ